MSDNIDCCFREGNSWFRYRAAAVIIADGYALFADNGEYYYSVGGGVHIGESSAEAVLREITEETGLAAEIERPLCLAENFFSGDGALEGVDCHTIELYYLLKPTREATMISTENSAEKLRWLPIDRLNEYDIRPSLLKQLAANPPESFLLINNKECK